MKRFLVPALLAAMLAALPPVATAAPISPGCQQVNQAVNDGYYAARELAALDFFQGEVIRVRAADPSDGAIFVHLLLDQTIVAEAGLPGRTLSVVPADRSYVVGWDAGGSATWRVSCAAPTKPFAPQASRHTSCMAGISANAVVTSSAPAHLLPQTIKAVKHAS